MITADDIRAALKIASEGLGDPDGASPAVTPIACAMLVCQAIERAAGRSERDVASPTLPCPPAVTDSLADRRERAAWRREAAAAQEHARNMERVASDLRDRLARIGRLLSTDLPAGELRRQIAAEVAP